MENELGRIVDALPGLVWTARPDGHIDFLNQRWCEYTGLSVEEALGVNQVHGRGWQTAIHPEDLSELLERWRSIPTSGEPCEMEARLRRFDGEYRWFIFRASPLSDASGQVVKWCGMSVDIEDRRRAEEAARAPEARFRLILDGLPASFITSIIGRPVNVDSGPCAMASYLNEQVIAADLTTETRWAEYAWCPMALAHGLQACWSTPISSTAGKVLGAFAIYYDEPRLPTALEQSLIEQFTHIASIAIERVQSDAALKQSEAFLAEAQHLSLTGSFSWRVATDEITWSEQLYRIFELDQGVPVTRELINSRVHPEDLTVCHEIIERACGDGSDVEYEHRLQMPDHSVKYLHVVAHGTRDQDGRLEYLGAIQDVTERRRSEEALGKVRSELAHVARVTSLGALTASIAHEVNQPLSGIITNASTCLRMLAADPPNIDGARETARRTIRDGNRASDVITRLCALFIKRDVTTESVDLNEATREVIALSWSELQRSRVILRPELADELPPVTGDRVQLQQVILNLIRNASDAMEAVEDRPRLLVIRTERDEGDAVRLSVQDAGAGFEPQGAERVFEAFYITKSDGMGIGLSVSRSIIESHHGRLCAAPNNGPGVTFSFSIPRRTEGVTGASLGAIWAPAVTDARQDMRNP